MTSRPRVLILAGDELFATFFSPSAIARLEEIAGWERRTDREDSPSLRARIATADVLITTWQSPFLRVDMLESSRVRAIIHCGGEVKARMEEGVFDRVTVVNTPEPMAAPVAEMALTLMLALVRRLPVYDRAMRGGGVPNNQIAVSGETLAGRRVGIVGLGRVGRSLVRLLEPHRVEILANDPHARVEDAQRSRVLLVALDDLLLASSVVVLAAALTPETRGLIDRRRLALLPDGAALVNVARGGLVDTDALVAELESGRISAALDVTDPLEPLPADHALRRLPNVILTPHVAGGGLETRHAMAESAIEELARILRNERPASIVTRDMLARMT